MNGTPLLVFITRLAETGDESLGDEPKEWTEIWRFPEAGRVALIQSGQLEVLSAETLTREHVQERVGQCDVVVVHGVHSSEKVVRTTLNNVDWSALGREVRVRVHPGRGCEVISETWRKGVSKYANLSRILEKARAYSLEGKADRQT